MLRARRKVGVLLGILRHVEKLDPALGVFTVLDVGPLVFAQEESFAHRRHTEGRVANPLGRIVQHRGEVQSLQTLRNLQATKLGDGRIEIEKFDEATKRRLVQQEISRLQKTQRRRDLLYGIEYTPPPDPSLFFGVNESDIFTSNNSIVKSLNNFVLDDDLDDIMKELDEEENKNKKEAAAAINVQKSTTYQLEDDDPVEYKLDDDDDFDLGKDDPQGIGAAKNEELMRRMKELKDRLDYGEAASEQAEFFGGAIQEDELIDI